MTLETLYKMKRLTKEVDGTLVKLKASDKSVLVTLFQCQQRNIATSRQAICEYSYLSATTVRASLKRLVLFGLITVEHNFSTSGDYAANTYIINEAAILSAAREI